jgi:hypothetical protein
VCPLSRDEMVSSGRRKDKQERSGTRIDRIHVFLRVLGVGCLIPRAKLVVVHTV